MTSLPQKLIFVRTLFNYSQNGVARYLGISQSAYAKWERGLTEITPKKLAQLAHFYSLEAIDFTDRDLANLIMRITVKANH
jgi:transcriptional regulator with XRE-family HTH domain